MADAKKEMPKIADSLKEELLKEQSRKETESKEKNDLKEKVQQNIMSGIESFPAANLKHTETKEKVVLPAPEDIQAEKTIQGVLQGVEKFESESLKNVKTREPLSPTALAQVEKARGSSLAAVADFDKTKLKKSETTEKNPLPNPEDIAQEMEHLKFKNGIEGFDRTKLAQTTTMEKNLLPTPEIIAQEKSQ